MITIQQARVLFNEQCGAFFGEGELQEIFARCMDFMSGEERLTWKSNSKILVDETQLEEITDALKRHEPLQYILGEEWFGDLKLSVNKYVLIPRPETYELVLWVKESITNILLPLKIIDVGTGSGCIPIWLKKQFPQHKVSAIDISESALDIAAKNAEYHHCQINFLQEDMLQCKQIDSEKFDIIISNPPYITDVEKLEMDANVLEHEPHLALFVTNGNPLQFYDAILQFALHSLETNGIVFMEINRAFSNEVKVLFENAGFETELRNDMYGNPRMIMAKKSAQVLSANLFN